MPALALPEFHELITDLWLTRNDEALRNEESIRRKGRPPSAKELALKEQKLQDETEYRSGLGAFYRCISIVFENIPDSNTFPIRVI